MDTDRALVVACLPSLRRYARALLGNQPAADDLVQDTVERGLSKLAWWRPGSNMRAWLFSIMHNLYVDQWRAPPCRDLPLDDDDAQLPDPDNADAALLGEDIDAALATLPAGQREVLLLVVLEDMSYDEVAKALQIPVGTVMSRLARAREKLRRALGHSRDAGHLKVVR